jgi:hypothetical protein
MNLMSVININEVGYDHRTNKASKESAANIKYGYSIYQSLEYNKANLEQNSFKLQMEMMKSFIK